MARRLLSSISSVTFLTWRPVLFSRPSLAVAAHLNTTERPYCNYIVKRCIDNLIFDARLGVAASTSRLISLVSLLSPFSFLGLCHRFHSFFLFVRLFVSGRLRVADCRSRLTELFGSELTRKCHLATDGSTSYVPPAVCGSLTSTKRGKTSSLSRRSVRWLYDDDASLGLKGRFRAQSIPPTYTVYRPHWPFTYSQIRPFLARIDKEDADRLVLRSMVSR